MTEKPVPQALASAFSELSGLLLSRETPESTLRLIAALVVRVIPGCDGAGVSLIAGRHILTVAQTDQTAEQVDHILRVSDLGVGSMIAFPLRADDLLGSLNLYATKRHAFTRDDGAVGAVFAAHAAVALANSHTHAADPRQIETLRSALDTRSVISQAVGILMERESISSDEAFQRLTALSQRLNRKLRAVAQDVLRLTQQRRDTPRPG
jgi:ANTAR domain/GAF domain